ncbi:hypothetical protein [Streptomyces venezuelae]|uniref:hypothetical protein n=1 Tax=Streptomyces venezuelae TaxID=54571 RepID=UPI001685717A|nr:hypothetical protein [Streptomyces venezuelae]
MSSRARTLWSPLAGVLLIVLGLFCAPAPAPAPTATATATATATVTASPAASAIDGHEQPGCGKGARGDGEQGPAAPPRTNSPHELLPALCQAHGATGSWGADQAFLDRTPVRGPPEPVPLSPVDLSVLRV